jgi:DNA-binding beta-propeller fold protein YncE
MQKFDGDGTFLTKWGSQGTGDGQFLFSESGIGADVSGNVYVADSDNHRIQKFDGDGTFLTKWGSQGTGDGQFHSPKAVAVDAGGNVYVADWGNNRIQKFAPPTSVESVSWSKVKEAYR